MRNEKPTSVRFTYKELALLKKASELTYDEEIHRKNYSISSFVHDSALSRAKRVVSQASK